MAVTIVRCICPSSRHCQLVYANSVEKISIYPVVAEDSFEKLMSLLVHLSDFEWAVGCLFRKFGQSQSMDPCIASAYNARGTYFPLKEEFCIVPIVPCQQAFRSP